MVDISARVCLFIVVVFELAIVEVARMKRKEKQKGMNERREKED